MKVKLEITKAGKRLHQGTYEIDDTDSFAAAWKDVWIKARERWMANTTSIGDLIDSMHEAVIEELNGAEIKVSKV